MKNKTCVSTQIIILVLGGFLIFGIIARKDLKGLVRTETQCR